MTTEMRQRSSKPLVRGLLVCLLVYSGVAAAAVFTEVEPNNSLATANSILVPPEGLTISAVIGQIGGRATQDVDYFAFDATQGDTLSIKVVGAMQADATGTCTGFSSIVGLFDALGKLLGQNEATCPVTDAFLNNVTLPATGKYFVAVSGYPHYFTASMFVGTYSPGGPYQLVINDVRHPNAPPAPAPLPTVKHVPIEVMDWDREESLEKGEGQEPIQVAILSMKDFDAMTVDPNTLTFGSTGNEKSLIKCHKHGKDVNHDGHIDMICYFKSAVANFQTGDLNGVLKAKTKSGMKIEGSGALKTFTVSTEKPRFKNGAKISNEGRDGDNDSDKQTR